MTETPEWLAWKNMHARCSDPKQRSYPHYGGRGITVCERWATFENFFADVGAKPTPDHSVGRIDNDGNYEPSNVRWETWTQQQRNRSNNRVIEYAGVSITMTEWGELVGLTKNHIHVRLKFGWPLDLALFTPAGVVPSDLKSRRLPVDRLVRLQGNAHAAVHQALRAGRLIKPNHCQFPDCDSTRDVQGHHHNGYEKEHWLDVVWLCRLHHELADHPPK